MHHIYTTPGFIVTSRSRGEAGKFLLIFTRDLGMIAVTAEGVRHTRSKLRYHTEDYSGSLFSLVRGKEVWRLTGAKEWLEGGLQNKDSKKLFVRILSLLKRLLPGEEKNETLFIILHELYLFLSKEDASKIELVEFLAVLRILSNLGYLKEKKPFQDLLSSNAFNDELLDKVHANKALIVREINSSLKESQL